MHVDFGALRSIHALLPEQNFPKMSLLHAAREQLMCIKHILRELQKQDSQFQYLGAALVHWPPHVTLSHPLQWLKTKAVFQKIWFATEPPSCCWGANYSL